MKTFIFQNSLDFVKFALKNVSKIERLLIFSSIFLSISSYNVFLLYNPALFLTAQSSGTRNLEEGKEKNNFKTEVETIVSLLCNIRNIEY